MLFRKKIEPRCAYCRHAGTVDDVNAVCRFKGIVDCSGSCRRFRYDALRRVPVKPAQLVMKGLSEEDFKIG